MKYLLPLLSAAAAAVLLATATEPGADFTLRFICYFGAVANAILAAYQVNHLELP